MSKATKVKAPFKRGTKLLFRGKVEVKYIKWWGFSRAALIIVEGPDGTRATVHVNEVKEVK